MYYLLIVISVIFFEAEDGIRDLTVTGVQTCALPISLHLEHFFTPCCHLPRALLVTLRSCRGYSALNRWVSCHVPPLVWHQLLLPQHSRPSLIAIVFTSLG